MGYFLGRTKGPLVLWNDNNDLLINGVYVQTREHIEINIIQFKWMQEIRRGNAIAVIWLEEFVKFNFIS